MAGGKVTRAYLVAFNLISFFGWSMILTTLVRHLALGPRQRLSLPVEFSQRLMHYVRHVTGNSSMPDIHLTSFDIVRHLPKPLIQVLDRAGSLHAHAGALVAVVQTLALLEILHALAGMVKTPVVTTTIQVFSRLFLVWGICERYTQQVASPWYASMVFAWSLTECIRYPFYANALMGSDSPLLLWARYTFFYVLYPLGATSEAMLMFRTLPNAFPWNAPNAWTMEKYVVAVLFAAWWPGLYVMDSHMRRQRRKALGGGGGKKAAAQRKKGVQSVADATWATGEDRKKK